MQTYFANILGFYCSIFHLIKLALHLDKNKPLSRTAQILTLLCNFQIKPIATYLQQCLCCILQ